MELAPGVGKPGLAASGARLYERLCRAVGMPELVDDPQVAARGAVVEAHHPEAGDFRQLGAVLAGQTDDGPPVAVPDWSVTQTDDLLAAAGYDRATIEQLRTEGVIA